MDKLKKIREEMKTFDEHPPFFDSLLIALDALEKYQNKEKEDDAFYDNDVPQEAQQAIDKIADVLGVDDD